MEKPAGSSVVALLRDVAERMAAAPHQGTPTADARLLRELATRLLDSDDPWCQLVLATLERVLGEGTPMTRAGSLALAEMLRELDERQ